MTLPNFAQHALYLATLGTALALTGCGGGAGALGGGAGAPSAPVADAAAYDDMMSYCGITAPTGMDATQDGWSSNYGVLQGAGTVYYGSTIISPAGSAHAWSTPLTMSVPFTNYKGVTGPVVSSGYAKPEWKMGVAIPTVLSPRSVGCVTETARVYTPPTIDLSPGYPTLPQPQSSLIWTSYWSSKVPVSQLQGTPVDGFELVSNFAPASGVVYFVIDKASFAAPQTLSICRLAPKATQWNCVQPSVADAGENWSVTTSSPAPGVYVLLSPTPQ
ncbi:hypothetical protein [Noviherbaspirillum autotrophicum]|nr:hypothetical protein [Noviherbaspirillum autotrophicum]